MCRADEAALRQARECVIGKVTVEEFGGGS